MTVPWRQARCSALGVVMLGAVLTVHAQDPNYLKRLQESGLPTLTGAVPAYYSQGHREDAQKLQAAIEDMNVFYKERLGVQASVTLALLDSKDWTKVTGNPYGLPMVGGTPPVVIMPATSDNPAFGLMKAREAAIPAGQLQSFLNDNHTTFEAVASQFVDLIGFHELGHTLTRNFGIDPKDHWFDEFLANYWSYEYISESQPEWKRVFDLLGRPSKVRPKNTSLEDLERLYVGVDDYGWYQGMFEARIREIYPVLGLKFLTDVKQEFPRTPGSTLGVEEPLDRKMKPEQLVEQLEIIAPGFKAWAVQFSSGPQAAAEK